MRQAESRRDRVGRMTSTPPPDSGPDRTSKLPLWFALGVFIFGLWAAWLTSSWVVLGVAVFVAVFPARTYASDARAWSRRQDRRNQSGA